MIFKIIAFLAAAIPIFLFVRSIFFRRTTRVNEGLREFKKQANLAVSIFLFLITRAFSRSTEKSWPHFRPPPVDFCSSRLAIGAATECARAPASAGSARSSLTNATLAASRLLHRRSPTAPCSKGALAAHRKKLAAFLALGGGFLPFPIGDRR